MEKEPKSFIRIVEYTRHINWDKIFNGGSDYSEECVKELNLFLKKFPNFGIKIGKDIVIQDENDISNIFDKIKAKRMQDNSYNPFGHKIGNKNEIEFEKDDQVISYRNKRVAINRVAEDLVDALQDEAVAGIWLQGGANRNAEVSAIEEEENYMVNLVNEIHKKTVNLKAKNPPVPMVGYCFAAPLLFYLSARNLITAVHGPLAQELQNIDKSSIEDLNKIFSNFSNSSITLEFNDIKPANKTARNLVDKSENSIEGIVVGGLLQIVTQSLRNLLLAEEKLGINLISHGKKEIILFIEALDIGNEVINAEKLFDMILKNKITVKALVVGYTIPKDNKNGNQRKEYNDIVDKTVQAIAAKADKHGTPVCYGLKVGHIHSVNQPIIFGEAKIYFDKNEKAFKASYNSKQLQFLNIENHFLWNKNEREKAKIDTKDIIDDEKNISDALCTLF